MLKNTAAKTAIGRKSKSWFKPECSGRIGALDDRGVALRRKLESWSQFLQVTDALRFDPAPFGGPTIYLSIFFPDS